VLVAIGGIAVLAEPRIVVEPGRADLGEAQRRPERPGDPAGPAGLDGVAVAVAGRDPVKQQIPLSGLAVQEGVPYRAGPPLLLGGEPSGRHQLDTG